MDELVGPPPVQWQIPRLLALAGDLEMRHAASCVPESRTLNLQSFSRRSAW
jgi:hypothetical protein